MSPTLTHLALHVPDLDACIAFYQRFGFVHEGTQRAAYKRAGEDGYVDELMYGLLLEA